MDTNGNAKPKMHWQPPVEPSWKILAPDWPFFTFEGEKGVVFCTLFRKRLCPVEKEVPVTCSPTHSHTHTLTCIHGHAPQWWSTPTSSKETHPPTSSQKWPSLCQVELHLLFLCINKLNWCVLVNFINVIESLSVIYQLPESIDEPLVISFLSCFKASEWI